MHFVVFPDTAKARPYSTAALARTDHVVEHPSGRPWIIGDWEPSEIVTARVSDTRLVLLGTTGTSVEELRDLASRVHCLEDVDAVASSVTGSTHLVASVGGHVRVQGTLSTTRQIFHTQVSGVTLAADRPQSLASTIGSGVDEERLALHLLAPFGAPWPLDERTLWKGVDQLLPGHYLEVAPHGRSRVVRWWRLPRPELSLRTGAARVATALEEAVSARAHGDRPVCADLSGGMDSTTLAFLVAEGPSPLVTLHNEPLGDANDDTLWAERCRAELPGEQHVTIARGTGPALYSPLTSSGIDLEGPLPFARARAHYENLAEVVAGTGARHHLSGVGGDELFQPSVLCVTALTRSEPWRALPHVRRFRHRYRWSVRHTLKVLERPRAYASWLGSTADRLGFSRAWGTLPETDWEVAPRMPPWATRDAVETVRRLLREAALAGPEPMADEPVHHAVLRLMQVNGRAMRMNTRIAEHFGVSLEAPYTDDRVIEAALSVRLADRLSDGRPKPVLARAMRGRVPYVFDRTTKGDASAEIYSGVRQHRADLENLCSESLLADSGLIDADVMRSVVTGLHADTRPLMPFDATLGLELWLRTVNKEATNTPA